MPKRSFAYYIRIAFVLGLATVSYSYYWLYWPAAGYCTPAIAILYYTYYDN